MPKFKSLFSDEEIFYVMIAGLSHDMGHSNLL